MNGDAHASLNSPHASLVVAGISAGYGRMPVLQDLNFSAAAGECIAILGPNGVGKTTTMRLLTGLVRPTAGQILWQGIRIDRIAPHKIVDHGIAIVPEGRRLYSGMTVEDNLRMGAYHLRRPEVERRLAAIYDRFPLLGERWRQTAATLSGGQQQVCAIGRALMSNPQLLLIDELSLGLSPAAITDVVTAIKLAIEMLRPTVVVVDQDVNNVSQFATRAYFLERGTVVASGDLKELIQLDRIKQLYFSDSATPTDHVVSQPTE